MRAVRQTAVRLEHGGFYDRGFHFSNFKRVMKTMNMPTTKTTKPEMASFD
jgi:hypothetical protein